MRVVFEDSVDNPVPDPVGRAAYRIVQEGITNATKHAPGAPLTVQLSGCPTDGLTVELRNPVQPAATPPPGAGLGLVGLSERAEQQGGRLEHGHDRTTFWLAGWLPWTA